MMDAHLDLRQLTKRFGATTALLPTSFSIRRGEFVTVLGPSGCGKSTLLRMLMGILTPSGGEIYLAGQRIDGLPPERRDIAMVFQNYALFPHLSVRANLAFGLQMKGIPRPEQQRRIAYAVEISGLEAYLNRMPRELSGGQQQRVALARAIVMQPALMLFDEPLSNLDAKLRESLRDDLLALHRQTGATSVYVTHDQTEAMAMSDQVVVMNAGQVLEMGSPEQLYHRPQQHFTATFLGQTNLLSAQLDGALAKLAWGDLIRVDRSGVGTVTLSARPETLALEADDQGTGTVIRMMFLGFSIQYDVAMGTVQLKIAGSGSERPLAPGTRVRVIFMQPPHVLETTSPAGVPSGVAQAVGE